ncbi:hypothetical protein CPB86DRAFT_750215 [Serendipita vermifera]|nr:hypothetical protein CPB86DRAFT_750215 [Serendipita vermifera]
MQRSSTPQPVSTSAGTWSHSTHTAYPGQTYSPNIPGAAAPGLGADASLPRRGRPRAPMEMARAYNTNTHEGAGASYIQQAATASEMPAVPVYPNFPQRNSRLEGVAGYSDDGATFSETESTHHRSRFNSPLGRSGESSKSNSESTVARPFECPRCHARFSRNRDKERHERSVHTGNAPYLCEGCGARFVRSDARGRHWKQDPTCQSLHQSAVAAAEDP